MKTNKNIKIYTDGGCYPNPGKGSWAFVVVEDGEIIKESSGFEKESTNNQMELTAAIKALQFAKDANLEGYLITDSEYVKKGLTEWIKNWIRKKWKTATNKPVKNKELWIKLYELYCEQNIIIEWTKGHDGNYYNDLVDRLCTEERENN